MKKSIDKSVYRKIRELAYQGQGMRILAEFSPDEIKAAYDLVSANWNLNNKNYTPAWCYLIMACAKKVESEVRK
jgi:hypothetical protein